MLTTKMNALWRYLDERLEGDGVCPSFEEMREALALQSKSGVHRLIGALEERGYLRRLPNRARAIELVRKPEAPLPANVIAADFTRRRPAPGVVEIPLFGRIAAGLPIEAIETPEMLAIPTSLLGAGDHYALEVSGDSMQDAGIFDGDFALIRRCEEARDGDIVVALIDEREATLKYLRREGGMIRLDPANTRHQPQRYVPSRVRVQGRLAGLLRRY